MDKKDFRLLVWFTVLAVLFLTLYPVGELSRCVISYCIIPRAEAGLTTELFYSELALVWGFYICIPFLLVVALCLAYRMGRGE